MRSIMNTTMNEKTRRQSVINYLLIIILKQNHFLKGTIQQCINCYLTSPLSLLQWYLTWYMSLLLLNRFMNIEPLRQRNSTNPGWYLIKQLSQHNMMYLKKRIPYFRKRNYFLCQTRKPQPHTVSSIFQFYQMSSSSSLRVGRECRLFGSFV